MHHGQPLSRGFDPLHPTITDGICAKCSKPFKSESYTWMGRTHIETLCDCCRDIQQKEEEREREARDRAEAAAYARDRHESEWSRLCPYEFRLPSETGGNTSVERMDAEHPGWRAVLEWKYGHRGLIVRGETGHAKTRAVWRLLRRLFDERHAIRALTAGQFDRECRDAAGKFTLSEWFESLASIPILFLDDLGKASWTNATEANFFDLVDQRTREGRPILVTSNDNGESLKDRLSADRGEPLIRRLRDYCDSITL